MIKIIEQDIIFLSYDEPNAEKNYADLVTKVPWAKRCLLYTSPSPRD